MTVNLKVVTTISGWSGGPGIMTHYWRPGTGGGSVADATDCAARVRAFLNAINSAFPTSVQLNVSGTCEAIDDLAGTLTGVFTGATPAVVTGGGGANYAPKEAAILVQSRSSLIAYGRFLRGRTFLSPVSSTAISATGTPTIALSATITTAANAMLTGGGTASFPVVWGRARPAGPGTSGPVTAYTVWTEFASLRSRRD